MDSELCSLIFWDCVDNIYFICFKVNFILVRECSLYDSDHFQFIESLFHDPECGLY